jgi:hypothetical protein
MGPRRKNGSGSGTDDHYDPATRFLYVPHTVTFLVLGAHRRLPLRGSRVHRF